MHGKRGTLDYLQKFDICDNNICIMCKKKKETNRHALCFCTHSKIVDKRLSAAATIKLPTRKYGGTKIMEEMMYNMFKPGKTGAAINMRIEEFREQNTTKLHCPTR